MSHVIYTSDYVLSFHIKTLQGLSIMIASCFSPASVMLEVAVVYEGYCICRRKCMFVLLVCLMGIVQLLSYCNGH